jgi:hypothetical protein
MHMSKSAYMMHIAGFCVVGRGESARRRGEINVRR